MRSDLVAIDLRSLAAFRVGLAATLLLDLAYRCLDLEAHYSDLGVLPRAALERFSVRPGWHGSLHALSGETSAQVLLVALAVGSALALGVGYRTRLAVLTSWWLLASLQDRNPLILIAGDRLLLLLLFWGLFLPLGSRWSLDARGEPVGETPTHVAGLPALALLVQTALVYASTALYKWSEPVWRELDAVALTLQVEGVATGFGRGLLAFDALPAVLTAFTLAIESLAPLLAFSPWRRPQVRTAVVLFLVAFHLLGLGLTLRFGLMQLVFCVAWVPFLPTEFWDRLRAVPKRRPAALREFGRSRLDALLTATCSALVLVDTAVSIDRERYERNAPGWSTWLIHSLELRQEWRMWQRPLKNRYYVFAARMDDGSDVDLHTGQRLDWDAPRRRSKNNHWWKYQDYLSRPMGSAFRADYARFLAAEWSRAHPQGPGVSKLSLVYLDASRSAETKRQLPRRTLWEGSDLVPEKRAR